MNRDYKPGTLLQSIESGTNGLVFQPQPQFDYARAYKAQMTSYLKGDFFVWLQADNTAPSYYCFCLHSRTCRILSMSNSRLVIVDLEEEVRCP